MKTYTIEIPPDTLEWLLENKPQALTQADDNAMNKTILGNGQLQLCGVPQNEAENLIRATSIANKRIWRDWIDLVLK